jgi:hypothetical protein
MVPDTVSPPAQTQSRSETPARFDAQGKRKRSIIGRSQGDYRSDQALYLPRQNQTPKPRVIRAFFLCHYDQCRKDTGSAHAANLFSPAANILWILGQAQITTYRVLSTQHQKSLCSHCGPAVPCIQVDRALLAVPAECLPAWPTGKLTRTFSWLAERAGITLCKFLRSCAKCLGKSRHCQLTATEN